MVDQGQGVLQEAECHGPLRVTPWRADSGAQASGSRPHDP